MTMFTATFLWCPECHQTVMILGEERDNCYFQTHVKGKYTPGTSQPTCPGIRPMNFQEAVKRYASGTKVGDGRDDEAPRS